MTPADEMNLEPLFTIAQVARYLQVSTSTVYQLVKNGVLAGRRIGQSLRFSCADIDRMLDYCACDANC